VAFTSWRGVIGIIKPTLRPGSLEEFIKLLPDGIGVIPLHVALRRGTRDEFQQAMGAYEAKVEELASLEVDVIHPEGAPPFMVHGYRGEQEIVQRWEQKHRIPIVTAGMTHVESLRALGIGRFVGVTYFQGDLNDTFSRYFRDAGFEVLAMEGLPVPFEDVGKLSAQEVYAHTKRAYLAHTGAEAIYMLGSGWRTLDIVDLLEQDLGVPVIHPVPARLWALQKRLRVRQPCPGFGRLLREMP
jgi:maleate isomerase